MFQIIWFIHSSGKLTIRGKGEQQLLGVKRMSWFGEMSSGFLLGGVVVYFILKSYLPAYLTEKAKNLASKEDIGLITAKVEAIKLNHSYLLEEVKNNNQVKFAEIERAKAIKKEVYMEVVEAITRCQNAIINFCNLDMSEQEITTSTNIDTSKIAKVQVVGSKETVKAITTYMASNGSATLDLMLKRRHLISLNDTINTYQLLLDKINNKRDQYLVHMEELCLQNNKDPAIWDMFKQKDEFEKNEYMNYEIKRDLLIEERNKKHVIFVRECMEAFFNLYEMIPSVVLSIRHELDLHIASEDYIEIVNKDIEMGRLKLDAFLKDIEYEHI
ncbi:hypothetical protein [Aeromonas jandaei]|uniref:hypothetical protein n=1 Tax=Aeromonas jandaei TaxID=650 RepID=UPI003BA04AC9